MKFYLQANSAVVFFLRCQNTLKHVHSDNLDEMALSWFFKLISPQSPRGFSALARLYYFARQTKTVMLRRLAKV